MFLPRMTFIDRGRRTSRGVMDKVLDFDIVISEIEFQTC